DLHDFTPYGLINYWNSWLGEDGVLVSQFRDKFITVYKWNERRNKIDPVTNIEEGPVIYLFKGEEIGFSVDKENIILKFLGLINRKNMESL
ncbi:MAG: hypothetical protein KKG21_03895, partial [Candidatus Omnitrophica bacterium]|nr:hypothetical protein [Candidatus Omnitrophota bacterium]